MYCRKCGSPIPEDGICMCEENNIKEKCTDAKKVVKKISSSVKVLLLVLMELIYLPLLLLATTAIEGKSLIILNIIDGKPKGAVSGFPVVILLLSLFPTVIISLGMVHIYALVGFGALIGVEVLSANLIESLKKQIVQIYGTNRIV